MEFETELTRYPAFKTEVETQRRIIETIKKSALFLTLDDIHNEQFGKVKTIGKAWWQNVWLNVIGGILSAVGFGVSKSNMLLENKNPESAVDFTTETVVPVLSKEEFLAEHIQESIIDSVTGGKYMTNKHHKAIKTNPLKALGIYIKLEKDGSFLTLDGNELKVSEAIRKLLNDFKEELKRVQNTPPVTSFYYAEGKYEITGYGGHALSGIVSGLRIQGFGVYSCDGVALIHNRIVRSVTIKLDVEIVEEIRFVSLMDLSLNAAFSFSTKQVIMDGKGNNLLIVFTKSDQLLLVNPNEMRELSKNASYVLTAKNVIKIVNNSSELFTINSTL